MAKTQEAPAFSSLDPISQAYLGAHIALVYLLRCVLVLLLIIGGLVGWVAWLYFHRP